MSNNISLLKEHYQSIYKNKMSDVPIVNNNLEVEVVGFTDWDKEAKTASEIGILITPWFMNIVLLPKDAMRQEIRVGKSVNILLPDGEYSFLTQSDESFGIYLTCSLFSPMFEFKTQEQAIETAEAIMVQLLQSDALKNAQNAETTEVSRVKNDTVSKRLISKEPISRRNFLRGELNAN